LNPNNPEMQAFIQKNAHLFWWIRKEAKPRISLNLLVRSVIHYGELSDIRELFKIVGMERVAMLFKEQNSRPRNPYPKRTAHYFDLYFRAHVPCYIDQKPD